ncbi:MAG: acyl carrier protein [Candidatus Krumholzibacteriia bacterium]
MIPSEQEVLHAIGRVLDEELGHGAAVERQGLLARCEALDSLGAVTLAVALEDRYRVKLAEADAPELETFGDLAALVVRRCSEGGGGSREQP